MFHYNYLNGSCYFILVLLQVFFQFNQIKLAQFQSKKKEDITAFLQTPLKPYILTVIFVIKRYDGVFSKTSLNIVSDVRVCLGGHLAAFLNAAYTNIMTFLKRHKAIATAASSACGAKRHKKNWRRFKHFQRRFLNATKS